eukprot:CAMPEP_0178984358 /NCGR_PEP_ID=MMETSP0795-20121207/1558_1 /TAXON_ID=88552 /ORGANISM="Amoebophrya sp., Strain Ameob2" /LENGTH=32 /DNA_ID= /DNA_START= /DNA_END= /DNA_ORIENTATION=
MIIPTPPVVPRLIAVVIPSIIHNQNQEHQHKQ